MFRDLLHWTRFASSRLLVSLIYVVRSHLLIAVLWTFKTVLCWDDDRELMARSSIFCDMMKLLTFHHYTIRPSLWIGRDSQLFYCTPQRLSERCWFSCSFAPGMSVVKSVTILTLEGRVRIWMLSWGSWACLMATGILINSMAVVELRIECFILICHPYW